MATENSECNRQNLQTCIGGVGSGVTSLDFLRVNLEVETFTAEGPESQQKQSSIHDRMQSQAAGEGILDWSLWGGYLYSDFESVTRAPYEATLNNFVVGADALFTDQLLVGGFLAMRRWIPIQPSTAVLRVSMELPWVRT